jgi:hypothetical protein
VDWGFIWLMVVLKVPVGLLLYICWWAVRQQAEEPEPPASDEGEGGGNDRAHRPPIGRGPRPRGPHGQAMPPAPPRTRVPAAPPRRAPVR